MAVTKLVLVRHGESQWNNENRFTGWYDVDLSEKGVGEAKAAGKGRRSAALARALAVAGAGGEPERPRHRRRADAHCLHPD